MAAKTFRELTANTAPASDRIIATQAPSGSAEPEKTTLAQLSAVLGPEAATHAVYVSKVGNDADSGLTNIVPKLTIGSAITAASALITGGATTARVEVMDGGYYEEDVSLPAGVHLTGPAATVGGEVELTTFAHLHLAQINATANGQVLLSMVTGDNGFATARVGLINGVGYTGVKNVRNVGGSFRALHVYANIINVGEDGIGIGDATAGIGHLHVYAGDLYLLGDNAIGILGDADGSDGANIVGFIDHIIEIQGAATGTIGISMVDANARVRIVAAEIIGGTAYSVTAGDLYLTCPRIVGTRTGNAILHPAENISFDLNVTGSVRRSLADKVGEVVSVKDFGARGDGVEGVSGQITNGSTAFSTATNFFSDESVGKTLCYRAGLSAPITTSITGVNSATSVTLEHNATETASGVAFAFGTDDALAFANAVEAKVGTVFMTNGVFLVGGSIDLPPGVSLRGVGPGGRLNPGSRLVPTGAVTGNFIQSKLTGSTDFQHWTSLLEIHIDARYQGGVGDPDECAAINFWRLGECATIDLVHVNWAPGHGIVLRSQGTPVHIGKISVHRNGHRASSPGSGLLIDTSNATHNSIDYLAGDDNKGQLLRVRNLAPGTLMLHGFKSERNEDDLNGHNTVFEIIGGNGGHFIIGTGFVYHGASINGEAIISTPGDTVGEQPHITVLGSIHTASPSSANYVSFYKNYLNRTIPRIDYARKTGPYSLRQDVGANYWATTAQLENQTNFHNTINKFPGAFRFNTTTNKPVWSSGFGETSAWVDAEGNAVHAPVMP